MKLGESSESAQKSYAGFPVMQSSDWLELEQREEELLKQEELNTVKEEKPGEKLSVGKYRKKED